MAVRKDDSFIASRKSKDLVPQAAMLDAWARGAWDNGIQIDLLENMQKVTVRTTNTLYEITIIGGQEGEILVRGGRFLWRLRYFCWLRNSSLACNLFRVVQSIIQFSPSECLFMICRTLHGFS